VVALGKSKVQRTEDKGRGNRALALAVFAAGLALVLTCRKWDNPHDPVGNHPPTMPFNPSPADFGMGKDSGLVLSWQSQDPDIGDTAYFKIFFDTDSSPRLLKDSCTATTFQPTDVGSMTHYYWRVTAYDNHGDSAVGPLWRFQAVSQLRVTAPDSGARLTAYSTDTIIWTGGPTGAADSIVIHRSTDDGLSWIRLGQVATPGEFIWQVPAPATEYARVKVVAYASTDMITGTSDRFAIIDSAAASSRGSQ
jgi:hypothetical protein